MTKINSARQTDINIYSDINSIVVDDDDAIQATTTNNNDDDIVNPTSLFAHIRIHIHAHSHQDTTYKID